ncbi:MAG: hypothetical protein PWP51_2617 [Clostridiales bacterium]|nr:hypothetical protein [Clostridiales bacterium]MDN5300064.1 hypothetical protein [Clostridiales bacterium]
MSKVLEIRGDYKILVTNRDYIVVNTQLDYENHAHFKSVQPMYKLISLIESGILPHSPYLLKAAKRLLGDDFDTLTPQHKKETYKNHHRKSKARYA